MHMLMYGREAGVCKDNININLFLGVKVHFSTTGWRGLQSTTVQPGIIAPSDSAAPTIYIPCILLEFSSMSPPDVGSIEDRL